ncbi:MoaD/ThiS family protein [Geopsychrobacter electrodiphilus]|uniref:MoaD/ThiS family protein n=1 Tax=Geopsychrobacter electrodiphilus TaxID=225196 RepID=UPI000361C672|nr:MoaD/ThiS family protein [Geopsychrobacter electrodiphilus]
MKVSLKCFAQLVKRDVCDYRDSTAHELPTGASVNNLIDKLGFQGKEIKLVYVNNVIVPQTTRLHEGDRVAFAPATGGM